MFLKYDKIFYKRQKEKAVTCNRSGFSGRIKYLTIIPRARVGYEMIDSQRGA